MKRYWQTITYRCLSCGDIALGYGYYTKYASDGFTLDEPPVCENCGETKRFEELQHYDNEPDWDKGEAGCEPLRTSSACSASDSA